MKYVLFSLAIFSAFALPSFTFAQNHVSGRILLDVESHGEAWYVHPESHKRYYLGRPEDAYQLMRKLGLGISEKDFARFESDAAMRARLAGYIVLQVERRGEAWYIDPVTQEKTYLANGEDAFRLMKAKGLGISRANLNPIQIARVEDSVLLTGVPFTAQAPLAEWNDLRQQEGCEEASVMMAMSWATGIEVMPEKAREAILAMSNWQEDVYGTYHDTSAWDTNKRLFNEWYNFRNTEVQYDIATRDIHAELVKGNLVLVPINAKAVRNPNFLNGGPERHMIVVLGYDAVKGEFITHDPGTKNGNQYRYHETVLQGALRDYATGAYAPIGEGRTAMIIVKK